MADYDLSSMLQRVRHERPLVHVITNYVAMHFAANTLLAMGALPVMADDVNEVEEMVSQARALVINIGTPSAPRIEAMLRAGTTANTIGVPVVLDPVGVGATSLRTHGCRSLTRELQVAVVRGNASEILAIASDAIKPKGVEAAHAVAQAQETAKELTKAFASVVAITGEVDLITNGETVVRCSNGHSLLGSVTATGCAAAATIAAFAAVSEDPLAAACAGLAFFGLAGELAATRARSPGSFMVALIDALYEITPEEFQTHALLEKV